jgi:hypothetical protein
MDSAKRIAKTILPVPIYDTARTAWRALRSLRSKRLVREWSLLVRDYPLRQRLVLSWPGAYLAKRPARYAENLSKYSGRGGAMRHEELAKFADSNGANYGDLPRFYLFNLLIDQLQKEGIDGDMAELGVYRGNTAFFIAKAARLLGRTAYLFDTFDGFALADLSGIDADKAPEFADTSIEAAALRVGRDNVRFVRGYFPNSVAQVPSNLSFSFVHIDCDLYIPFCAALRYFYPRLAPGGFLVMHDYMSLYWDGVEKAVDEFFADKPEKIVPIPDRGGSVVIRKMASG